MLLNHRQRLHFLKPICISCIFLPPTFFFSPLVPHFKTHPASLCGPFFGASVSCSQHAANPGGVGRQHPQKRKKKRWPAQCTMSDKFSLARNHMLECLRELQSTSQCLMPQVVSAAQAAAVWWPAAAAAAARPEQTPCCSVAEGGAAKALERTPPLSGCPSKSSRQPVARLWPERFASKPRGKLSLQWAFPPQQLLPRQHPARANVSYSPGHQPSPLLHQCPS